MTRPPIIQPHHLERLAVFYGRQSTPEQVESNPGSAEYQRRQMRFAREWGWPDDRVRWFDDFGLTGAAAEHRPEYREMRRLVQEGDVALVGAADLSRLGRDAAELLFFLGDCNAHDVLVAIDGKISNLRDPGDWLYTAIFAILSQHGALNIRDTLQRGRMGQLQAGRAVTHPPVGYDKGPQGEWMVTSDLRVRAAISTVFRVLLEVRSLRATVIRLLELHAEVPVRGPSRVAQFRKPDISRVYKMLRNPNYTPDYHYRRRVVDLTKPRTAKGHHRLRKATPEELIIKRDHHEGYITREQRAEMEAIFRTNSWSRDHTSLGHGDALVQGLVRCVVHREWLMRVHYKERPGGDRRSHAYHCEGDYKIGGRQCRTVVGRLLDDAVLQVVLRRLSPPSIEAVRETLERVLADARAAQRNRTIEVAHLRQRIADLERKLDALDPDSFQVFKHVERELETAKRRLVVIESADEATRNSMARQHAAILSAALELAPDIPRILSASTTKNRDRKELLRIMVRAAVIEEWGAERLRVRLHWADEAAETLVDVWLPAGVERLITELRTKGESFAKIACSMNDLGIKTGRGSMWAVKHVRNFLKDRTPRRRARRHDRFPVLRGPEEDALVR